MNDVTTGQAFKYAVQPTEKLEIAPDILEWFKKRGAFWEQAKWTPRLENALVANSWSIRWTFGIRYRSLEGHHEHLRFRRTRNCRRACDEKDV
jgi:hypothetical protein